jgi:hypothetical protein
VEHVLLMKKGFAGIVEKSSEEKVPGKKIHGFFD